MGHNRHSDNTSYDNNNSPSVQCAAENTYHDLKLLSLNVCGLKSKLKIPEFIETVNSYDIVALQESKLDDVDNIEVPGYTVFCQKRKKISRYRSDGTAFLFRHSFNEYITTHESESKLIQWIRISKHITKTDNVTSTFRHKELNSRHRTQTSKYSQNSINIPDKKRNAYSCIFQFS